jgi:hypothetical protein
MRVAIGEYASMESALRAVRALESRVSVQQVTITDKRPGGRDRKLDHALTTGFVVSMTGTRECIDQARDLLRLDSKH